MRFQSNADQKGNASAPPRRLPQSCVVSVFVRWSLADMHSVLLHAEIVPNSISLFIRVHPPSHDAL